jgi:hypothetical protein
VPEIATTTSAAQSIGVPDVAMPVQTVATGISGISGKAGISGNWYDLNGRRLSVAPTMKGVYIQNGRKVVIK